MQKYTEIPSSATLEESLPLILDNDKTSISCHEGSAFPTVNIQEGMLCYRSDQKKLYQLVDMMTAEWRVIADLTGDARNLDGGFGNSIRYDKFDMNSWIGLPTGFYEGVDMLNAPSGDTEWRFIQIRADNSDGYSSQIAFGVNTGLVCSRFCRSGIWSEWKELYHGANGELIANLNADMVDGKHVGNLTGNIPVNDGKLNSNLNADMVDGKHVGNLPENIPVNNAKVNTSLNADMVDGKHAGNEVDQIPINNSKLNVGLNAEMVGGVKVDSLLQVDSEGNLARSINEAKFHYATIENFAPKPFEGTIREKSAFAVSDVTGKIDATGESGSGNITSTKYTFSTGPGIPAGSYSIDNLLQRLVKLSHTHAVGKDITHYNCTCDTDVDTCDTDRDTCDSDVG